MSLHEAHHLSEEDRIVRLAGMLIEQEMRLVREALEKLRCDLALTNAMQRHELQTFFEQILLEKRIEQ